MNTTIILFSLIFSNYSFGGFQRVNHSCSGMYKEVQNVLKALNSTEFQYHNFYKTTRPKLPIPSFDARLAQIKKMLVDLSKESEEIACKQAQKECLERGWEWVSKNKWCKQSIQL